MKALSFGEILWDIFPDSRCLGGAPLNVAGHLARLGVEACIVSALGKDPLGSEALELMKANHIDTRYVESLPDIETGFTRIKLTAGIPEYEFNFPCAWDSIALAPRHKEAILAEKWDVFCFGTLSQRSETSRVTLREILQKIDPAIVFCDINLRKQFYSREILEWSLEHSDILKMNDEESPIVSSLLRESAVFDEKELYAWLIEKFALKGILVTRGKKGVSAYFDGKEYAHTPSDVKVVDTVGAGDSFSAAFLVSLFTGKSIPRALELATDLADFVVSRSGALPEYDQAIRTKLKEIVL